MRATMFHTSHSHVDRFDAFRDRIAPNVRLTHVVREDWLERALAGLDDTLSAEITNEIRQSDAPICTCTTIGSVAEQAGALRVDQPMMARAAQIGGPVLFAYCLHSTLKPSLDLLKQAFAPRMPDVVLLDLGCTWHLFESGQTDAFEQAIATKVEAALEQRAVASIVLAQASMSGAAALIRSPSPVLTSPEEALRDLVNR